MWNPAQYISPMEQRSRNKKHSDLGHVSNWSGSFICCRVPAYVYLSTWVRRLKESFQALRDAYAFRMDCGKCAVQWLMAWALAKASCNYSNVFHFSLVWQLAECLAKKHCLWLIKEIVINNIKSVRKMKYLRNMSALNHNFTFPAHSTLMRRAAINDSGHVIFIPEARTHT